MTKGILISFCLLLSFSAEAQEVSWLSYLKSVRNLFFVEDTIVFTFKSMDDKEYSKFLKPLHETDCKRLFNLQYDLDYCGRRESEKYFYSYYLTKDHFALLTFLSFGKYTPVLTLYNYSPSGKLLKRIEVRSDFGDAGQADSTVTHFKTDSTFVVRRWDGFETTETGKSVVVDSITKTNYLIKPNGRIFEGTHSNTRKSR